MKTITIENIDTCDYSCPESWKDFSTQSIVKIHSLQEQYRLSSKAGLKLLLLAFNIPILAVFLRKSKTKNLLTLPGIWLQTILKGNKFLGFMFEPNGLDHYPLRSFRHRFILYRGPEKRLLNLKTIELIAAYSMFYYYSTTKESKYLNKLISLLYRPQKTFLAVRKLSVNYDRDPRKKLNAYHWERREKRIASLNIGIKNTILRQFSSEWALFEKKYNHVFSGSGSGIYNPDSWIQILMNMSGGVFGTLDQIKEHNATEVFMRINSTIKDNKERLSKIKK